MFKGSIMTKEVIATNGVVAAVFGMLCSALGGWSMALQLLVCLIVADYATGLMVGFTTKTLCSSTGFKGLCKKIVTLMMVAIAARIDATLNTSFLRDVAVFFYISNEGLSLLENTSKLGVQYPKVLRDALLQLKKMSEVKEGLENADTNN